MSSARGAPWLTYRATVPLSRLSLTDLADLQPAERVRGGTGYRRLDPGPQALLVLAHLRVRLWPARARRFRRVSRDSLRSLSGCVVVVGWLLGERRSGW
jgi:hypothetical protein